MFKQFFVSKGVRIRKHHAYEWLSVHFSLLMPFVVVVGFVCFKLYYPKYQELLKNPKLLILPSILVLLALLGSNLGIFIFMKASQFRGGFALKILYEQMVARVIKDGFMYKKTRKVNGTSKTVDVFPKVYVKRKKSRLQIMLPLDGRQFHERFLQMSKKFEEMFLADLVEEERLFGYVRYSFLTDVIENRISIDECVASNGRVRLMKDVYWDYDEMPHMLIAGGTGGGKTYFLYSLIKALLEVGTIDICDPKNADLADLASIPVFKGHIYYGNSENMIRCIENAVKVMEKRFDYMKSLPNYESGHNYAYYDIPPHFVIVDEWKAFYTALDYKTQDRVNVAVQQLVMKARQAGVFLILATQRPDANDFPSGVRDNLMCKITIGKLSPIGYMMVYGDDQKNKAFFNKKIKGRGYIDGGNGTVSEFYAPFVPKTYKFLEVFKQFKEMITLNFDSIKIIQQE